MTPAPGTQRQGAAGGRTDGNDLGFDPDSPDLADPQVDPIGPAKVPNGPAGSTDKRAKGDAYPPYGDKGQQGGRG
ncbi:DUF6021 family protein [Pseudomonas sp. RIT-PI-S]|uniref:DUF6021 family protein n=1 Tax=Pseudomonas sp. RIT-PI-S TaxID=3035295 RepID=UPI0021D8BC3F|nr:DUF6021 family protein [Pseudomonas sp. RIT-PI-S]